MKRILAGMVAVALLMSAAVAFVGVGAMGAPAALSDDGSDTWTIMVYLCADNNLEDAGLSDLVEMETAGSTEDVTVVVLMDTFDALEGTHWYVIDDAGYNHVLPDGHDCDCEDVLGTDECPGEMDMGDGATLTYFLVKSVEYAPADHYMLILWDHGGGWRGVCWDDSTLIEVTPGVLWSSRLTTPETATAIAAAEDEAGFKLDIIGYDACLNGAIEVVYENRDIADYMFASLNLVPWDGMNYTAILEAVERDPGASMLEIGTEIVDDYVEFYANVNSVTGPGLEYFGDVTLSFFQLGQPAEDLVADINALAHELVDGGYATDPGYRGAIASAESQTPRIPTYMGEQMPSIDLGLFADKLGDNIPELEELADAVVAGVDEVVMYENHMTSPGGAVLRTSGISVMFTWCNEFLNPVYQLETMDDADEYGSTLYWGMAFVVDTYWDEFVFTYCMTDEAIDMD